MERKHRHILEISRSLFFQLRLLIQFWGKCVLSTVHLLNKIPLQVLNFLSSYEMLYGDPPDLSYLKVFGCLSFVNTIENGRIKFDPRTKQCTFIGYPVGHKGYKILDMNNIQVSISRDVVFHKQHFPFYLKISVDPESTTSIESGILLELSLLEPPVPRRSSRAAKPPSIYSVMFVELHIGVIWYLTHLYLQFFKLWFVKMMVK